MSALAINRNLRDSMVVFLSSVAASGLVFLFQLIVAKDLGLREFGSFVLLIEIMSMIILLSDAGLAVAFVNLFVKARSRSSGEADYLLWVSMRWKLMLILGAVLLGMIVSRVLPGTEAIGHWVFAIAVLGAVGESFYQFGLSMLQAQGRIMTLARDRVLLPLARILLVGLLHLAGLLTLESALLANAAMAVGFGMLIVVRLIHRGDIEQVALERRMAIRGELQKMLRSTQIASICVIATAKIQFFLVDVFSDSVQLGTFAAAHRYSMVASILTVAATTVLMPLAAAVDSRAAFDKYRAASWRLSACFAVPVLALVLFADPILPLLFGAEFDVAVVPAQIMLLGLVLSMFVTPLSYTFYNASAAPALAWLNAGQLVFSCVVGLVLIPTYGAIGAAWVSLGVNVLGLAVIVTVAATVSRRLS